MFLLMFLSSCPTPDRAPSCRTLHPSRTNCTAAGQTAASPRLCQHESVRVSGTGMPSTRVAMNIGEEMKEGREELGMAGCPEALFVVCLSPGHRLLPSSRAAASWPPPPDSDACPPPCAAWGRREPWVMAPLAPRCGLTDAQGSPGGRKSSASPK